MLRNYFTIAYRNLLKNKAFSTINIFGLALGVFTCLTIFLFVWHELSYDQFHTNGGDIYRVNMHTKWGDQEGKRSTSPPPVAEVLMREIPDVLAATRIYPAPNNMVFYGNTSFQGDQILATDTQFFKVFSFKLLQGNVNTALEQPNSVVITPQIARKYFGEADQPIGKLLQIGKSKTVFKVTGIIEQAPSTSHFQYDLLTSINSYENVKYFHWSWIWTQLVTYVRLKPGIDSENLTPTFARLVETHAPAAFERIGFPYAQFKASNNFWKIYLQPLDEIWLHSEELGNRLGDVGSLFFVQVFSFIGIFILVLACINFVNLSTAGAIGRAREIGVRKVIGTSRFQLIYQFLSESLLICLLAVALGVTIMQLFTNQFSWIENRSFDLNRIGWPLIILGGLSFALVLSFLAGFYPAFYLSGFDTVKALKGHLKHGKTAKTLRNFLVVFQFCISVGMILVTLVVAKQMQFLKEKDLGFAKESLVVVQQADLLGNSKDFFKTQLKQIPGVAEVTLSAYTFPNFQSFEDTYQPKESGVKEITLMSLVADHDFISTLGLKLIAGRNFEKANAGDKHSVIISEMAAKQMGWANPIGKTLVYPGFPGEEKSFKVVGVVNNFHHLPMNFSMEPFLLFLPESGHPTDEAAYFLVRLQGNVQQGLAGLKNVWNKAMPGFPMQYTFVDEAFAANYRSYEAMQSLFFLFSGLAIVISCLGLLGLAVYATNIRLKEIGIRKVLGAPVYGIIFLLNRELIILIMIAFVLGAPVGLLLVQQWLQNFAYQATITLTDILLPALIVMLIALLTVSYISLKAARANPIQSLRNE